MEYNEIDGDLIKLAKEGKFDVIAHGCNCQCVMGAGIAPQMAKAFGANEFALEAPIFRGSMNKLGSIDFQIVGVKDGKVYAGWDSDAQMHRLAVVNAYTQFDFTGRRTGGIDLDYEALTLCMRKMNHAFKGTHIGLPQIGCGLAGGKWDIVRNIIQAELSDCKVTIVNYKP